MLAKVYFLLIGMAWILMRIGACQHVVDSQVLSNEIPHDYQEIDDNSIDENWTTTTAPQVIFKFIEEPEDIHAQLGTSLTLNCVISSTNGVVQWTKNHFGLGVDRNLTAYNRYSMVGDEKNGSFSLHIVDVNFMDEGFYQCQFSNNDVQMRSRYATVTVFRDVSSSGHDNDHLAVKPLRFVANRSQPIGSDLKLIVMTAMLIAFNLA